jgi:glycosyltransferase involved in cell wall biosynthesis
MLLSICIPNYKREECLNNCLNSIYIAKKNFNLPFEVCISDNNSGIKTEKIISF